MATLDALLQLQRLMAPGGPGSALPSRPQDTTYYSDINPRPSGLPDAVRESILQGRSYGEGQVMPRPADRPGWLRYSDFERERQLHELGQFGIPGREDRLIDELEFLRSAPGAAPRPEGFPLTAPDRYSPGRPYNLGLGNLGVLF